MNNQPNSGVTDINEIMRMGENSRSDDASVVNDILQEISNDKQVHLQVQQQQQQQQQQQAQQTQQTQQAQQAQQAQQQAHIQMRAQQEALEDLVIQNRKKDEILRQMSEKNSEINDNTNDKTMDLLTEFKPTLIIFSIITVLTLPVINKFICTSIGIEENTIYSILRTFIISVIFFLLNKFI